MSFKQIRFCYCFISIELYSLYVSTYEQTVAHQYKF